jgi:carbamoyl-phosphate synthase large subunit
MSKSQINVMVLSAGRRVELVQRFKRAAQKLNVNSVIVAVDVSPFAPALFFADKHFQIPRIDHPDYISDLIRISKQESISLIIPTIDTELIILSKNKHKIEKETQAKVLISSEQVIDICRDKIKTSEYLNAQGFKVPQLLNNRESFVDLSFPVFIKPKSGSSSIEAYKIQNMIQLDYYLKTIKDPIIQEFIEGEEYTVDVFLDFNSKVISIMPRLRMAVRSGEILRGKTVNNPIIIDSVMNLMKILKPIGHITVQLILKNDIPTYIEINPRFGGGAPMSIDSGADSCEYLYHLLMGEELVYRNDFKFNLIYSRFDQSICINEDGTLHD